MENVAYLCKVRLTSEGANKLLSKQYSSWTFLTHIRGHVPQGHVLSFSTVFSINRFNSSFSVLLKTSDFTTTALLL